jgi:hypothetical protein
MQPLPKCKSSETETQVAVVALKAPFKDENHLDATTSSDGDDGRAVNGNKHHRSNETSISLYASRLGTKRGAVLQAFSLVATVGLIAYAHLGLSGVFLSNLQRITETSGPSLSMNTSTMNSSMGHCSNDADIWRWTIDDGARNNSNEINYCVLSQGCLLDLNCTTTCLSHTFHYTMACASCFATLPQCTLNDGCGVVCQEAHSADCTACMERCYDGFATCTGWNLSVAASYVTANETTTDEEEPDNSTIGTETPAQVCARQQAGVNVNDIDTWHIVYEIRFIQALHTTWTGQAKWLAVVVGLFSGVWPYVKCLGMLALYLIPLSHTQRGTMLKWLRRCGKYTLVDIHVGIGTNARPTRRQFVMGCSSTAKRTKRSIFVSGADGLLPVDILRFLGECGAHGGGGLAHCLGWWRSPRCPSR